VSPEDYKYIDKSPKYYDVAQNREVVRRSVEKNKKKREAIEKNFDEKLKERSSALASYLLYLDRGGASSAERYFGKKYLSHLRGREILEEIKKRAEFTGKTGMVLP
jgi:hypothetical protein